MTGNQSQYNIRFIYLVSIFKINSIYLILLFMICLEIIFLLKVTMLKMLSYQVSIKKKLCLESEKENDFNIRVKLKFNIRERKKGDVKVDESIIGFEMGGKTYLTCACTRHISGLA